MKTIGTFKSKIGLKLESIINDKGISPIKSDVIECGGFIPAMILVLCNIYKRSPDVVAFIDECSDYFGLSYNEIPLETAENLFNKFLNLLNDKDN